MLVTINDLQRGVDQKECFTHSCTVEYEDITAAVDSTGQRDAQHKRSHSQAATISNVEDEDIARAVQMVKWSNPRGDESHTQAGRAR